MTLLVCGIDHHTAPIHVRERVAFSPDRAKLALQELMQFGAVDEVVILSTCNRLDIYSETHDPSLLKQWIIRNFKLALDPYWYFYTEEKAVSYIMHVASGLRSMVLGEPYIFGQMKDAVLLAQEAGSIGTKLQHLFQRVFNVSKRVRTDTPIGANPITFGFVTIILAKQIFSDLSKQSVLLIGVNDIIELTALHLLNQGIKQFKVASRCAVKAQKMVEKVQGYWIPMSDIPTYLQESDIVISATSSDCPILDKGAVEHAIEARKHRPIFMIDFAVPRDIEPTVAQLQDIYLYNIDDLKLIIDENLRCREEAARQAESIIALQARHYIRDLQALEANSIIKQWRENCHRLSELELERAITRIERGIDPRQVLQQFSRSLVNKFAHTPCTQIKKAAFDGQLELLTFARQLLDVE
jgi:glutamyl-tRNA reductase